MSKSILMIAAILFAVVTALNISYAAGLRKQRTKPHQVRFKITLNVVDTNGVVVASESAIYTSPVEWTFSTNILNGNIVKTIFTDLAE